MHRTSDCDVLTRRAAPADLDRCAAVLGDAFADYPWTRWTVDADDHVARVTALQRLALAHFGYPFGQVWVTEYDNEIACVAVWMDSEVSVGANDEVAAETARLEGSRHAASIAAEAQVAPLRPPSRHWYLATVGTEPRQQRRGLASAVLAPVLRQSVDCYLETSSESNVAFYGRLGFAVVSHLHISDSGPDVWSMLRRA